MPSSSGCSATSARLGRHSPARMRQSWPAVPSLARSMPASRAYFLASPIIASIATLQRSRTRLPATSAEDTELSAATAPSVGSVLGVESDDPGGTPVLLPSPQAVLIRLRDRKSMWPAPAGVKISSQIGNIVAAIATAQAMKQLRRDPHVVALEIS